MTVVLAIRFTPSGSVEPVGEQVKSPSRARASTARNHS
jgi:hypothetical protein